MMKSPYKSTIHIIFMGISLLFATHKIAYCDKKDIQEANESHKEISSNNIQSDQLYDDGNKFYIQKKYRDAIECYKKAIEIDNKKWTIYYNLARAQTKHGDSQEAIKNLNIFLKHYPNDPKGIDLKRVLAGALAAYDGPLTVFLMQYNNGVGYFDLYNTSDQDISVVLCTWMEIQSPQGTVKMNTSGTTLGTGGYSGYASCRNGNLYNSTIMIAHSKLRVNFEGHASWEKSILNGLNEATLEKAVLNIPIGYRNGNMGRVTIWNAQVSIIDK